MVRSCPRKATRSVYLPHDPDTLKIKTKLCGSNYVRIAGYDGPERGEAGFKRAMRDFESILKGKKLIIYPQAMNQGRVIAKVRVGGIDVAKKMKRLGW